MLPLSVLPTYSPPDQRVWMSWHQGPKALLCGSTSPPAQTWARRSTVAHISGAPTKSADSRTESEPSLRSVAPSGVIAKRPHQAVQRWAISGYWTSAAADGGSYSFILFDSEEAASA